MTKAMETKNRIFKTTNCKRLPFVSYLFDRSKTCNLNTNHCVQRSFFPRRQNDNPIAVNMFIGWALCNLPLPLVPFPSPIVVLPYLSTCTTNINHTFVVRK